MRVRQREIKDHSGVRERERQREALTIMMAAVAASSEMMSSSSTAKARRLDRARILRLADRKSKSKVMQNAKIRLEKRTITILHC